MAKEKKKKKSKKKQSDIKTTDRIITAEIRFKIAVKKDFLEVAKRLSDGKVKWKPMEGIPYWLINSKGEVDNKNLVFDSDTDLQQFGIWLVHEQVLIPIDK